MHSESQVKLDIDALYDSLMISCCVGADLDAILEHADTRDGLKTWMTMVKKYKDGGERDTWIECLEAKVGIKYYDRYKGTCLMGHRL